MLKVILAVTFLLVTGAALSEPVVIIHPNNSNALDAKAIIRIFLGKEKKFPDGSETIPVNQNPDSQTRQDFDKNILGRSTTQVVASWSKLVFTGKGIPPKELDNDTEVINLVSTNPSVIGYVDRASVTNSVKIVEL